MFSITYSVIILRCSYYWYTPNITSKERQLSPILTSQRVDIEHLEKKLQRKKREKKEKRKENGYIKMDFKFEFKSTFYVNRNFACFCVYFTVICQGKLDASKTLMVK